MYHLQTAAAFIMVLFGLVIPLREPALRRPVAGAWKVDDKAPDFTVKVINGKNEATLSELQGKPVVLNFGSCT